MIFFLNHKKQYKYLNQKIKTNQLKIEKKNNNNFLLKLNRTGDLTLWMSLWRHFRQKIAQGVNNDRNEQQERRWHDKD